MDMFENSEQIWCLSGDEYDLVSYDADTPCRKDGKLFLLKNAEKEVTGDFEVYSSKKWIDAICIAGGKPTIRESMYLWFNFPSKKFKKTPSNKDLKTVRKAVEKALSTDEFKASVEGILQNTKVSVVSRENSYHG